MIDLERVANSFGIFGTLRRLGGTAVAILQNRLELASIELKEEKTRVLSMAIWAGVLVFLGFMTVIAAMITVTFLFWEQRVAVMGGFAGFFLVGAVVAFFVLKGKAKTPPFAETIAQLKKDREWIQGETDR